MKVLKFHDVSPTHGYGVVETKKGYQVQYLRKVGQNYVTEANSHSNGKSHVYGSPFIADYAIRSEILPLYKKEAA